MKKIFTILCVTLFSLATMANGVEVNGIYYVLSSKTASVTYEGACASSSHSSYSGDVVIPETISYSNKTYTVTDICDSAFYWCSGLKSVVIPNSIKYIGNYTFYCCSNLSSIIIPNSVINIGTATFHACYDLASVTIGNSVTRIGKEAFAFCGLKSIVIPNSVTNIGEHAFWCCSSISSLTIPNSVTSISDGAFEGCSKLISVEVALDNQNYDSRENCNALIETATNRLLLGCSNTIIPNSVTTIEDNAFDNCKSLTSIEIPNSVITIGKQAFYSCDSLSSITIPNSVTSINDMAFAHCPRLKSITIGHSLMSLGNNSFEDCQSLAMIVVAKDNQTYDSRENCNAIIETATNTLVVGCNNSTIPNTVTSIGKYAFYGSNITAIDIPNSVKDIERQAFEMCEYLVSVIIPNSVASIGSSTFARCSSLHSITIGSSVKSIGTSAFRECINLTSITCLAINPPVIKSTSSSFYNVPRDIPLYVPASSIPAYQAAEVWNEFDIQPLLVEVDQITPDTTQLSWLPVDSASLYKLRIYSEQIELDTTLLIEADSLNGGISIPVTLAPNRVRRMPMDDIGSVVVITLEPNSGATKETPFKVTVSTTSKDKIDILFDLEVLKGEKTIKQESGSFALNAPVLDGLEDIPVPRFSVSSGIYDLYGRHYSISQLNQLPAGIYILREGEKASKVMKR